jgi:hypothetical protein
MGLPEMSLMEVEDAGQDMFRAVSCSGIEVLSFDQSVQSP